ncbi:hypothetical protein CkP1_0286 [Citrobacter phage CkP1]|nr:hypothetical protein CkP1_0286 [Citrobacter phage CkP1]
MTHFITPQKVEIRSNITNANPIQITPGKLSGAGTPVIIKIPQVPKKPISKKYAIVINDFISSSAN